MSEERKKGGSDEMMRGVAEVTLGAGLMSAMIAKQRCVDNELDMDAGVFETTIQNFRTQLTEAGLDPDEVIRKRLELLEKSLGK